MLELRKGKEVGARRVSARADALVFAVFVDPGTGKCV